MSFPLLRLPLVALREVIKSMTVGEILQFQSLFKNCHQIMKASIPKKSLKIFFTPERNGIIVEISPKSGLNFNWPDQDHGCLLKIGDDRFITAQFSTCGNCAKFNLTRSGLEAQDEESIRTVLRYFVKTIKPLVLFNIDMRIRHDFAMELIRYCRLNQIPFFCHTFECEDNASPEDVREILEDCMEENGDLSIDTILPKDFEYTAPPGGFRLGRFVASEAHWVNLNDFLQCENVIIYGDLSHMTPQYLNNIFKTIVNTECKIRNLTLFSHAFASYAFSELIRGLTDRPIRDIGDSPRVDFEGNDGRKTTILYRDANIFLRR